MITYQEKLVNRKMKKRSGNERKKRKIIDRMSDSVKKLDASNTSYYNKKVKIW